MEVGVWVGLRALGLGSRCLEFTIQGLRVQYSACIRLWVHNPKQESSHEAVQVFGLQVGIQCGQTPLQ